MSNAPPDHSLLASFLPFLIEDLAQLRTQAPTAYRIIQPAPLSESARRQCQDVFQSWITARFPTLTKELILTMLGKLTPLEQTRAYQNIVARNRPIWLEEARDEGHREEASSFVQRQLCCRFGTLTTNQQQRIAALNLEQLEALGMALLDFTNAADLDTWLDQAQRPKQN